MEEYKQYLSDHADDAERAAAAQVLEGLEALRLEAKVQQVATERADLYRRIFRRRVFMAVIVLTLGAAAAYIMFRKKETPAPTSAPVPSSEQPSEAPTERPLLRPNTTPPPLPPESASTDQPIAQLNPGERLADPRYPAPEPALIRGDANENKALKTLLNRLWYTHYPLTGLKTGDVFSKADTYFKKRDFTAAYLELMQLEGALTGNDTLGYLKGYCLLEMGEGKEAMHYFDPLQGRHAGWEPQLQWYRGLAMLLADEQARALTLFRELAGRPKHPYQRQAEKAVGLLRK